MIVVFFILIHKSIQNMLILLTPYTTYFFNLKKDNNRSGISIREFNILHHIYHICFFTQACQIQVRHPYIVYGKNFVILLGKRWGGDLRIRRNVFQQQWWVGGNWIKIFIMYFFISVIMYFFQKYAN